MDEVELYKSLGKRIKTLRENKNLTQEKLAEKTGWSLDFIGKIEVNKYLLKISNAFDIHIKDLFDF